MDRLRVTQSLSDVQPGNVFSGKTIYDSQAEGCEQDTVSVVPWEFWDGKILIELPSDFAEMDEEGKASCFPYEKRPEIIMEDRDGEIRLTLQFLETAQGDGDVYETAYGVSRLVKKSFPQYAQSLLYFSEEGGLPSGWIFLHMEELQAEHMKAVFLPENGRLLLLTVTYPEGKRDKWREVCRYIRESVRVRTDGAKSKNPAAGTGAMRR